MALRGLKPIAEIQYLDYILYALQILSDDLATMSYRTHGRQIAPIIVRTRGHRLEGIWHAGSPLGGLISFLRGILILTPRNMTKAAGFYNSLMKLDQPAIVIEPLNGYRTKEKMPSNLGKLETPIGEVDIIKKGKDLTIISYSRMMNLVKEASTYLQDLNISVDLKTFEKEMEELIKKFNLSERILVIKNPPREDVISAYGESEFLVLPSQWELSPLVPLESFAFKKPVISSNVHGIPYTVTHNVNGILVEPENHAELAKAIIELLKDKKKRLAYGNAGYHLVDTVCNSITMAKETLKVYEKTISK